MIDISNARPHFLVKASLILVIAYLLISQVVGQPYIPLSKVQSFELNLSFSDEKFRNSIIYIESAGEGLIAIGDGIIGSDDAFERINAIGSITGNKFDIYIVNEMTRNPTLHLTGMAAYRNDSNDYSITGTYSGYIAEDIWGEIITGDISGIAYEEARKSTLLLPIHEKYENNTH